MSDNLTPRPDEWRERTATTSAVLTPGERALWREVYAASWHQPTGSKGLGFITDDERALWAARQADRALAALQRLAKQQADYVNPRDPAVQVLE